MKNTDHWLIYIIGCDRHIMTDENEKTIVALMYELYHPYTRIKVYDYNTGKLVDSQRLDTLHNEPIK